MFPFLSLKNDVASPIGNTQTRKNFNIHTCSNSNSNSNSGREMWFRSLQLSDIICGLTQVSYSSCTSNTVNILLYVTWQIKVNDMFHIGDVQTPSCYLSV